MKSYNRVMAAAALVGFLVAGSSVNALPILGGTVVVASDGNVTAKFLGHTAGYSNDLYLDSPANALGIIFNNQSTPVGTTMDLGYFTAGTELIFRIYVNDTGDSFYTGPASRNPDQLAHAVVDDDYLPTETYVGFEDLFNGGDLDYDDLNFSFTNVRGQTSVPEAGMTLGMLSMGLLGLGWMKRRAARA